MFLSTSSMPHYINQYLLYWQPCPVVHQAHYQMDRETTTAPLLGALLLTPVTQGTGWLQVTLVEHVCLVAAGQGVIQHVPVSSRLLLL